MGNPLRGIKDEMPLQPGESLSCHVLRAGHAQEIHRSWSSWGQAGDSWGRDSPAQLLTLQMAGDISKAAR